MNLIKLKRPVLNPVGLKKIIENLGHESGFTITMSVGQWDNFLEEGYYRQGATLIEMNQHGQPIAAYRKPLLTQK